MILIKASTWEAALALTLAATGIACAVWWFRRRRPTAEEIEHARRMELSRAGRLVDGMLLDVRMLELEGGRTLTMLEYSYRIGGVEYECSQDVTALHEIVIPTEVRAGFPCSVRYMPGSPQNSIVVAEEWTGLRATLPRVAGCGSSLPGSSREQSAQTQ